MLSESFFLNELQWLDSFKALHKRSPRVLHIGNIANNAYNNAKILTEFGLENDVICYDYYHIMGTPEWEDADFVADQIDQFAPDWSKINLNGFSRPEWFVQGPMDLCINYLLAKNQGDKSKQLQLWSILGCLNKTKSQTIYEVIQNQAKICLTLINKFFSRLFKVLRKRIDIFNNILKPNDIWFYIYTLFLLPLFFIFKILEYVAIKFIFRGEISDVQKGVTNVFLKELTFCYAEKFPNSKITHEILENDLSYLNNDQLINQWKKLFSFYDVVIGYSTDGIYPLVAEVPYLAFEHGTIREIPYQTDAQGRLCAVTYAKANHVMVTNFDCKKSADFLAPNRYTLINHPFDENHGSKVYGAKELRKKLLVDLKSDLIFFFPTRHDWVKGDGYADKSNDIFINSFGKLREMGFKVGMVCCDWGKNVEASKKLLDAYNVSEYVIWSNPMATIQFERMAMACDCVVDQFKLGSFGGVLFKAMAVGAPILTYLDEDKLKGQYAEMPPVINCKNEQEIIDAVRLTYTNKNLLDSLRQKSQSWIKTHHSKSQILNAQLKQFKLLIQDK